MKNEIIENNAENFEQKIYEQSLKQTELLENCEALSLLDFILQLLQKLA